MFKQLEDKSIQFEKTTPYTFDEIKNLLTYKKEEANTQKRNYGNTRRVYNKTRNI